MEFATSSIIFNSMMEFFENGTKMEQNGGNMLSVFQAARRLGELYVKTACTGKDRIDSGHV